MEAIAAIVETGMHQEISYLTRYFSNIVEHLIDSWFDEIIDRLRWNDLRLIDELDWELQAVSMSVPKL